MYIFDVINHSCYSGDPFISVFSGLYGLYTTYLFMYVSCILYLSTSNLNISLSSSFEVLWKNSEVSILLSVSKIYQWYPFSLDFIGDFFLVYVKNLMSLIK